MSLSIGECVPDSYVQSIYDINYYKLHENGIKYAVFDLDCTLLPFDDINVTEENMVLFNYLNNIGIDGAICSSGFKSRVKPVADKLGVNYIYGATKPFVSFDKIKGLFNSDCNCENTVYVGDSLYLDMMLAARCKMNKILVDMIRDGFSFKLYPNDLMQAVMFNRLRDYGLRPKNYYRGFIER